jgi:hypothetical protein
MGGMVAVAPVTGARVTGSRVTDPFSAGSLSGKLVTGSCLPDSLVTGSCSPGSLVTVGRRQVFGRLDSAAP